VVDFHNICTFGTKNEYSTKELKTVSLHPNCVSTYDAIVIVPLPYVSKLQVIVLYYLKDNITFMHSDMTMCCELILSFVIFDFQFSSNCKI